MIRLLTVWVDAMQEAGIRAFGPNANAAIIEASKGFLLKNLMKKYGIPTAKYEVFNDAQKAIDYIKAKYRSRSCKG